MPAVPVTCAIILSLLFICAGMMLLAGHSPTAEGPAASSGPHPELLRPAGVPFSNLTGDALVKEVSRHHPINRLQCGNWVESYARLHKNILAGKAPQRYSIMRSKQEFGNGLADRLATSVSILLYSILTNRAFLYDWDPPPPANVSMEEIQGSRVMYFEPSTHLWKALRSDFIDWRYLPVDVGNDTILMDYNMDKNMDEYKEFFRTKVCAA